MKVKYQESVIADIFYLRSPMVGIKTVLLKVDPKVEFCVSILVGILSDRIHHILIKKALILVQT